MERRAFLSILAGSPLIFGLRELLAQDPEKAARVVPEWYRAALKRMKETRRYGVVFIVPDDPAERERWGKALAARSNDLLHPDSSARHAVVFIAVTKTLHSPCLEEAPIKQNRILLDPDGHRLSADQVNVEVLEKRKDFDSSVLALVWPGDPKRKKDRADELEKSVPDSLRKAVEELSVNEGPMPSKACGIVVEQADPFMPWVVSKFSEAVKACADERGVLRRIPYLHFALSQYWIAQLDEQKGASLPYGIKVESVPHDSCPSCGLQARPTRVRRFLEFFEK